MQTPTYTTVRRHPEFHARCREIETVAVLPPEVQVVRIVLRGQEEMHEEEEAVLRDLPGIVSRELEQHGFDAHPAFGEEPRPEAPELRFETTQIQRAYDRVSAEMYATAMLPSDRALQYECSVGPDVGLFAQEGEADALVFLRYHGWQKSADEVARDIVLGVLFGVPSTAPSGAILEVALVDGATGEVLWANKAGQQGSVSPEMLEALVNGAFRAFPY
jgi:hypothetical protein